MNGIREPKGKFGFLVTLETLVLLKVIRGHEG